MAIPKICGIETEWSIFFPKEECLLADAREFNLFLKVIREYFGLPYIKKELRWESCNEKAELELKKKLEAEFEMKENGGFLPNGARLYVDYPHLEYSTPECLRIKDLIAADQAGNCLLQTAARKVSQILGREIAIIKDNSDRRGHSYASHENYLLDRRTFWRLTEESQFCHKIVTFLVTRQILCGAGKLGIEKGSHKDRTTYQISQRADFITEIMGHSTTFERNIINLRDEPHADAKKFARLHLILGDANFCQWALYLRIGTTALVLKMLEDNFINNQPCLADPVKAIKLVSRDRECSKLLKLNNKKKMTAIDIQEWYWLLANKYAERFPLTDEEKDVLDKWGWFIQMLRQSPEQLVGYSDWKTKEFLIKKMKERNSNSSALQIDDILYHDINPEKGLYYHLLRKGLIKKLISDEEIVHFVHNPPNNTRAYLRGLIAKSFPGLITDWEEISYHQPIQEMNQEKDLTVLNRFAVIMDSPLMNRERAEILFRKIQAMVEAWKEV